MNNVSTQVKGEIVQLIENKNVRDTLQEKGQKANFFVESFDENQIVLKNKSMGNPRKWLLAGEGISNDTRSQSLPDCHDIKINNTDATRNVDLVNKNSPCHNVTTFSNQESWFNTWPEKIHRSFENITESHVKDYDNSGCDRNNRLEKRTNLKCGHLTFSEAINSFKLAYNPITKQLQLVEQCATQENKSSTESPYDSSSDASTEKFNKGHHRTIGASSFSSTVSTLSDPSSSGSLLGNDDCNKDDSSKVRKKSLTSFFSKKVFSSTGSWRLFGMGRASSNESLRFSSQDLVASSSALIQHIRPPTLPAKDLEEERKHRDEYEAILQAARKREIEHSKARRKRQERQLKQEDQLSAAAKQWANHILPLWDTMYNQKKTRELWWQGLPPSVRGRIWILAIGNELNITPNLYNICLARAHERLRAFDTNVKSKLSIKNESYQAHNSCKLSSSRETTSPDHNQESSMDVIQLDISRTFPNLGIFQNGGPYFNILHELLAAYVCYRPDVGYVQGMSFLAAILILNMEPVDAFTCFANLINRPLMLAAFTVNQTQLNTYFAAYNQLFKENLPKLYDHFKRAKLSADLYLLDWIYTVFAKAMPLDLTCRVWDLYLRDGDEFIFRTALGILHLYQNQLLTMDFLDGAQFLTRLPDDMSSDELFRSIKLITISTSKRTFVQLLDKCKETVSSTT